MVSVMFVGCGSLIGTTIGYLAGSIFHATDNAPSQHIAEAMGLSRTASSLILMAPAVTCIGCIARCEAQRHAADEAQRRGDSGGGEPGMDFFMSFARTAFLFSAVLGYFLGAAVADLAGWYGLLGVFVAICVVPVILIMVVIPVLSCLAPYCEGGGGRGCCATPSADGRAAPPQHSKYINDQAVRGINDQGAHVKQGPDGHTWYCGRLLGRDAIPGSNGQCGPKDGPQCESCKRYQSGPFGTTPPPDDAETRVPVHPGVQIAMVQV